jgi:hypothetical protein
MTTPPPGSCPASSLVTIPAARPGRAAPGPGRAAVGTACPFWALGTLNIWRGPSSLIQPASPLGSRSPRLTPRGSTRCWRGPSSPASPALSGAGRSSGRRCGTTWEMTPRPILPPRPARPRLVPLCGPLSLSPRHPASHPCPRRPAPRSRPWPLPARLTDQAPATRRLLHPRHRLSLSARTQPKPGIGRPAPAPHAEPSSGTDPRPEEYRPEEYRR